MSADCTGSQTLVVSVCLENQYTSARRGVAPSPTPGALFDFEVWLRFASFARIMSDMSESSKTEETKRAVMSLAFERPDWIPVLRAAHTQAQKTEPFGGRFAGSWVLDELARQTGTKAWRPGLRLLVAWGLLEKAGDSTRGGRRAYYRMPDPNGVNEALRELDDKRLSSAS